MLSPTAALAHEGHHEHMGAGEAVRHLLTQPDHLAMLTALAAIVGAAAWGWRLTRAPR
jgi:hypothetical protein